MFPWWARTVIEYVPLAVVLEAVTVKTDDPEVLIELVLSVADSPFTAETPSSVSVTVPLKFSGVTARLNVALLPCFTVSSALSTVIQKSFPTGVRLQADPTPLEGALKLEVESLEVALFHPLKSSFEPAFGVGSVYGVVEL